MGAKFIKYNDLTVKKRAVRLCIWLFVGRDITEPYTNFAKTACPIC